MDTDKTMVMIRGTSAKGALLRFVFCPAPLGSVPAKPGPFAGRLAKSPVDVATRVGMERANAYYAAGCPLELCDHAAARDIWAVMHGV